MTRRAAFLVVCTALAVPAYGAVTSGPGGSGVTVGNSGLIAQLDLSDTFTGTADGGLPGRPYIAAVQAAVVENTHGNMGRPWTSSFSFAQDPSAGGAGFVNGTPTYPGDANSGSATGFTQTGNPVDYGVPFGLRNRFVVQFDAVQNTDRVDITSSNTPGTIWGANSLSVFFRTTGSATEIGLFNAATETSTGFSSTIAGNTWNNYAVAFDRPSNQIEIFVNEVSRGAIDLNTFAGGAYANFGSSFVNVGGAGGNRVWTDNAQIGVAQNTIGPPELVSYWNFDESAAGTGTAWDQVHANNGTFAGSAARAAGLMGAGAARLNDTNGDGVNVGNGQNGVNNLFAFTSGITVEALINTNWTGADLQEIFRKEDGNNRILLSFQHGANINNASGQLVGTAGVPGISLGLNIGGAYGEMDIAFDGLAGRPTVADVADGQTHHLVATYDAATGVKTIWLDGVPIGSVTLTPGALITSGGGNVAVIGNTLGPGSEPFDGLIDEVAIYASALSARDIGQHYYNVRGGRDYFSDEVPEPMTLALFGLAAGALAGYVRRRREA